MQTKLKLNAWYTVFSPCLFSSCEEYLDPAGKSNSAFRESVASNFGPSQRETLELGNGSGATLGSKKLRKVKEKDKDREQEEEMRKKFYNLRIQHQTD